MNLLVPIQTVRLTSEVKTCKDNAYTPQAHRTAKCMHSKLIWLFICAVFCAYQSAAQGTWSTLTHTAPHANAGVMLVLTDGTIMCKTSSGSTQGNVWDKLTPDVHGSYKNGTWTSLAPMTDDRLYFSSQVLKDGRVYVAGGEYGSGLAKGETYNPQTNTWTEAPVPGLNISDANSELLPDGRVLQAAVASDLRHTFIFDPVANTYIAGPTAHGIHNESAWVKLPDGSILFVDRLSTNSERYIPASNTWVTDATVPVGLYDPYGEEAGAGFLLPNGTVFFIGSTSTTAIYTPSGTTAPGTWAAGPDFPGAPQGAPDAPAAMMVNGNILCVASPTPTSGDHFPDSSVYFEYNYSTNSFTTVNTPFGGTLVSGFPTFIQNMVCLPDGTILFSYQGSSQYYIYTPGGTPLTAGKPALTSILRPGCDTFTAVGTLFNGITEGAAYGDDWQNASDYPLIRFTSGTNVYYARTYSWNRLGAVMTGAAADTVQFILPPSLPAGTYTVQAVANGNASAGISFTTCATCSAPPVSGPSTICSGTTATLSDAATGGTWSSSNPAVATVNAASGAVTGIAPGTAVITYTASSCTATQTVTVIAVFPVTGALAVCNGTATTLADTTTGGAWGSGNTGVATVSSTTGLVTSAGAGTAVITYTSPAGCTASATVTVNPAPSAITGPASVCAGSAITLADAVAGGSWSSTAANVSVAAGTGVVTGISAGAATITYSLGSCITTAAITVNVVSPVTGAAAFCSGTSITLADAVSGGAWSSGSTAVATVDAVAGTVTGTAPGNAVITYTSSAGCVSSATVTVNPAPSAITGSSSVCAGSAITLADAVAGGGWSSAAANVSVDAGTGIVTGISAGAATVTYSLGSCITTAAITVNVVSPVTGAAAFCSGTSITLADAVGGGAWSSGSTAVATVDAAAGTVTGIAPGNASITYTSPAGCVSAATVTVNPVPGAITGLTSVCAGSAITLADAVAGGSWSSAAANVSVDAGTGIVTGISAGAATVTYSLGSCITTAAITVNVVSPVTGAAAFCSGTSITLADAVGGGAWSSGSTAVATVDAAAGTVTGIAPGNASITYTSPAGCVSAATVTVNPVPGAITGLTSVCAGSAITLADAVAGGSWSSAAANVSVDAGTGIVTGISAGAATVTYSLGSCITTAAITVNVVSPVTGAAAFCSGTSITLADAVGGGAWSSGSTAVATVDAAAGTVTGIAPGNASITYTSPAGCVSAATVTVNPVPGAITGLTSVCAGSAITLADAVAGGSWSSAAANVSVDAGTGIVTGISAGAATITYSLGSCITTTAITVNSGSPVTGAAAFCSGTSITLADAVSGGAWSSGGTGIATVNAATGVVTGIAPGNAVITYTSPTGCTASATVTVNSAPLAITGIESVCAGSATTLSNATAGGTWAGSSAATATVVATSGVVTGAAAGVVTITYSIGASCRATALVTVNALPAAISGPAAVCTGATVTLTGAGGGTWSSSALPVATVVAGTGIVTGVSAGVSTIAYTLSTGCGATKTITVTQSPAAITGLSSVCAGSSVILADAVAGGSWSSTAANVSVAAGTGVVTGISAGAATVTYSLGSCITTAGITVNSASPVTGASAFCSGTSITLSDAVSGGTWRSGSTGVATVNAATGVVTGIAPGTAAITYTSPAGCVSSAAVTVNSAPSAITGTESVCAGSATTLSNATAGGTWASSSAATATVVATSGVVTGAAAGVVTITYTMGASCRATALVTINALPATISGLANVCVAHTINLTDAGGGTWSSGTVSVATVAAGTGVVTGVLAGTSNITYTLSTGCKAVKVVSVNAAPSAITGSPAVCTGSTITLSETIGGGSWSSSNAAIATAGPGTGVVGGVAAGTVTITYAAGGCTATKIITVNTVSKITGAASLCAGATLTLADATAGGTWKSGSTGIATVPTTTGTVTGVAAGTTVITYTSAAGCAATAIVTVSATPAAITGTAKVCVGATTTLADGISGGTWTGSAPATAAVSASSGLVTGVAAGTLTVTYTLSNGCKATKSATVNANPVAITGVATVCTSSTTTLTDAGGGTWSSSRTTIATVVSITGVVHGVAAGTTIITYTLSTGCFVTKTETSEACKKGAARPATVCAGSTITLMAETLDGVWTSSDDMIAKVDAATGIVTGIAVGNATISYTTANDAALTSLTVYPAPGPVVITANPGTAISKGQGITFTATVSGEGPEPAYQWLVNGTAVQGANAPVFTGNDFSDNDVVACGVTGICSDLPAFSSVTVTINETGINHITTAGSAVSISPNPNNGSFVIKGALGTTGTDEAVTLEIKDMPGRVIYTESITAHNGNINERVQLGSALASGTYILSLRSATATTVLHIVIEQ